MSEDAVAPVVAMMLILAVVATFFAAWNAYYVPSMKAQSEITHIREVETGFLEFSSDIRTAVSLKKAMTLSEPVVLGGGDFAFDSVRSGGGLTVWNASPVDTPSTGYVRIRWTNASEDSDVHPGLVKFSYNPSGNFWQNQGYGWSYGNTFVLNTERNLSTPLEFNRWSDITYDIAGSLVEVDPPRRAASTVAIADNRNCTEITIRAVNMTADSQHSRISGNGNAMLVLKSIVHTEEIQQATNLYLSVNTLPDWRYRNSTRWNETLWASVNETSVGNLASCENVVVDPVSEHETRFAFRPSPYPNVTLVREITEITVGAY